MMRKISVFMLINNRYHLREGKCPLVCLPYTKWWLVWHWEEKIHLHLDKWSSEHHILNTVYALELSWENWSSYLFEPLPEEMQLYCNMWYSWKEKKMQWMGSLICNRFDAANTLQWAEWSTAMYWNFIYILNSCNN